MKLTTLASGSKGNSSFIQTEQIKVLIDAGLSCKKIEDALLDINILPNDINAIFITHEHGDHIKGAGILSRKYNIPIYATRGTWEGMSNTIGKISVENKKIVYQNENIYLEDLCIRAFSIPHDTKEPVAYSLISRGTKVCVATDIGHITRSVLENLKDCSALVLESNHDEYMLKASSYPDHIKKRILGKYGHISNDICGKVLCCIMNNSLRNVFLAHISQETNLPDLAYSTVYDVLKNFEINPDKDIKLHIAKPYGVSELIEIK